MVWQVSPVTVTHADVLNALEGVKRLGSVAMGANAAYAVSRLRTHLKGSVEAIEAGRLALVTAHSTDGNAVDPDKLAAFALAWESFLGEPDPIIPVPLSIASLVKADKSECDVTPDTLTLLGPWLTA